MKKYKEIFEKTGENFNIFKILRIETEEVFTHSRFLCELLNPKGSHGKGSLFLNISCLFIILLSGCNHSDNGNKALNKTQQSKDTIQTAKNKEKKDSLLFYILSYDGKIIKTIKYRDCRHDPLDEFRINSTNKAYGGVDAITFEILEDFIGKVFGRPGNNYLTDIIIGDFNGDKQKEIAWLEAQHVPIDSASDGWKTIDVIHFSGINKRIKRITLDMDIYGISNLGDLNDDGSDEIGLEMDAYPGNTECFAIYTFKNNEWEYLAAFDNTLNMRVAGIKYIEKDPAKKGICKLRIPLFYYNDAENLIPKKYYYDSVTGAYNLNTSYSHVVELDIKLE